MQTLHLYPQEQKLFSRLSEEQTREFSVVEETLDFVDSPEKFKTRLSLARIHDPKLLALRDRLQKGEDLAILAKSASFDSVDDADLSELFFAMGPTALTGFITAMLGSVKTDAELLSIASLAEIRHSLLKAFNPSR